MKIDATKIAATFVAMLMRIRLIIARSPAELREDGQPPRVGSVARRLTAEPAPMRSETRHPGEAGRTGVAFPYGSAEGP